MERDELILRGALHYGKKSNDPVVKNICKEINETLDLMDKQRRTYIFNQLPRLKKALGMEAE